MGMPYAVVGAGYWGQRHADRAREVDGVDVAFVVDRDRSRAEALAARVGAAAPDDVRRLAGRVTAAAVAVPASEHRAVACALLEAGIAVLLEKPLAPTLAEVDALLEAARRTGVLLQVGHLERFNPAVVAARGVVRNPRFIEVHRIGPFSGRASDVDVVLDLMIHDLDLVLDFVGAKVVEVRAAGAPVLSGQIDIANARLEFANGAVANVTASRASLKEERKLRVFHNDGYTAIDFARQEVVSVERRIDTRGEVTIEARLLDVATSDPLRDEIRSFVRAVKGEAADVPPLDVAREAIALSQQIRGDIQRRLENC
ncbi:MAG: Gfo/Idh/MocA family oxidoreductase [Deltaproteobacteria bacterium]|nr:Gfo/Idh/MocA family oxidoreductase [Deltaproteobacteria bacterium]